MRPDLEPIIIKIPGAPEPVKVIVPPAYPHDDPSPERLVAYRAEWEVFNVEHPDFSTSFGPWGA